MFNFSGYGAVDYFFYALLVGAFVIEAWAFVDALRRPTTSFVAASKQTKPIWLIITGVALLIGIGGVLQQLTLFGSLLALPIVAFVAASTTWWMSGRRSSRCGPASAWVPTAPGIKDTYTFLSSRIVKEIARLGGDVSQFVAPNVQTALRNKLKPGK